MGRMTTLVAPMAGHDVDHEHRAPLAGYVLYGDLPTLLTTPVIYSLIVPFVLLDAWVSFYQAVCFRAWGLRRVRRRGYFVIDRHKLRYLNALEKAHCVYCGYINGLIAYVREVAARTEQYWCPIKHGRRVRRTHEHYRSFAGYGDAKAYREKLPALRRQLER
jgi:hypothetical protein